MVVVDDGAEVFSTGVVVDVSTVVDVGGGTEVWSLVADVVVCSAGTVKAASSANALNGYIAASKRHIPYRTTLFIRLRVCLNRSIVLPFFYRFTRGPGGE